MRGQSLPRPPSERFSLPYLPESGRGAERLWHVYRPYRAISAAILS